MPTVGEVQTVPGRLEDPDAGFRSRFDKADEHAEQGAGNDGEQGNRDCGGKARHDDVARDPELFEKGKGGHPGLPRQGQPALDQIAQQAQMAG